MTREEMIKEIEKINDAIFLEEMVDFGYNFAKVRELRKRERELEEMLKNC